LFHEGRQTDGPTGRLTDRRTDSHDEANSRFPQFYERAQNSKAMLIPNSPYSTSRHYPNHTVLSSDYKQLSENDVRICGTNELTACGRLLFHNQIKIFLEVYESRRFGTLLLAILSQLHPIHALPFSVSKIIPLCTPTDALVFSVACLSCYV
jgi:hypothetical protein